MTGNDCQPLRSNARLDEIVTSYVEALAVGSAPDRQADLDAFRRL
jgi:hypothetical protein